jgi:hypothetical protein
MNISRTYSFERKDGNLVHTAPRSLGDLKNQEFLAKAAARATELQQTGAELDAFVKQQDGQPWDTNEDFAGHVTFKDVPRGKQKISGGTRRAGGDIRQIAGRDVVVKEPGAFFGLFGTRDVGYQMTDAGRVTRQSKPESPTAGVRESLSVGNGLVHLTVSAEKPGADELLSMPQSRDFRPETGMTQVYSYSNFKLSDARTFDVQEPWDWTDTTQITDPKKKEDLAAVAAANDAIGKVVAVYDQVMTLDQSEADLNPRPGEVLFVDQQIDGKSMSGSIRPIYTSLGATAENPDAGDVFTEEVKPYMQVQSVSTQETFEAYLGKVERDLTGDYHDRSFQEIFIYNDGQKQVKAGVGSQRSWYEGEEPGWHPHWDDDFDYPMGYDNLGGAVVISEKKS